MIEGLKPLKKIKPNITGLIAKQCKENWQDVFVCWPFLYIGQIDSMFSAKAYLT